MSFTVTIKALDAAKHVAFGDQDTITLTSSDKEMTAIQVPLVNGQASPTITLDKAIQSATFTVSDNGKFTRTSSAFQHRRDGTGIRDPEMQGPVTAGVAFTLTIGGAGRLTAIPPMEASIWRPAISAIPAMDTGTMKVTNGGGTGPRRLDHRGAEHHGAGIQSRLLAAGGHQRRDYRHSGRGKAVADRRKLLERDNRVPLAGPASLRACSGKDLEHVLIVPTTSAAFHGDGVFAGMLLQQGQREPV